MLSFDARRFGCSPEVVQFYKTHVRDAPLVYSSGGDTTAAVGSSKDSNESAANRASVASNSSQAGVPGKWNKKRDLKKRGI